MPGAVALRATKDPSRSGFPETDHFWYRPQPPGPYIDSQRKNKAFGYLEAEGRILLSEDNGQTWPHSTEFADVRNITFS